MARLDYRETETDIPAGLFVRALVTLVVQQFNQLRAFHSLPALTRAQVIAAIKDTIKTL